MSVPGANMHQGVILFAHGARDPQWAEPFYALRRRLQATSPELAVAVAFLEHTAPDLTAAVGELADRGVERITLVPLFMGRGGHLRQDLPRLIARAVEVHPGVLHQGAGIGAESEESGG